jgi:WD40 repeat protein
VAAAGDHLAAAVNGDIQVWKASTGRLLLSERGPDEEVQRLALSPDGERLAAATLQGARVLDVQQGGTMLTLPDASGDVAFSPNGRLLATSNAIPELSGNGKPATVWDAVTGERRFDLQGHAGPVWAVAFSPDGRFLATAGTDRVVKLWGLDDGKAARTLAVSQGTFNSRDGSLYALAFRPDGKRLAGVGADRALHVWDLDSGEEVCRRDGLRDLAISIAYSPDGRRLITAGHGEEGFRVWDADSCAEVAAVPRLLTKSGLNIAFLSGGKKLAVAETLEGLRVYDVERLIARYSVPSPR